ncbi:MAG: protein-ribulosamine 3-kinase [Crocinitomix sp.]|jgi:protein-ribulosamine 3-kinase
MTHQALIKALYNLFDVIIHPVSGGDINAVYSVNYDSGKKDIIKINNASAYPKMFAKEAYGLNELRKNEALRVPKVLAQDELEGYQYLILENIPTGIIDTKFWHQFGQGLAKQHAISNATFGFKEDNYIGTLHQSNKQDDSWDDFLINERLIPLIKLAVDGSVINSSEGNEIERIYSAINNLWPKEKPALLHGDLWSGNYIKGQQNKPFLIDPAVYYGHREMDLGMMHLFGGFDSHLFDIYKETYALEKGWEERIKYNQLYPLLVHLNLFGRTYFKQIQAIVKQF